MSLYNVTQKIILFSPATQTITIKGKQKQQLISRKSNLTKVYVKLTVNLVV
jgi:hypothetical protein